MNRAGAKMPPAPPLPYENTVATSFIAQSASMTLTPMLPASATLSVS